MFAGLLLKILPLKLWLVGAVALAMVVAIGALTVKNAALKVDVQTCIAGRAKDAAAAAAAALKEADVQRAIGDHRVLHQSENAIENATQVEKMRADAVIADAASGKLYQRIAALNASIRAARDHPASAAASASASAPAGDGLDMLADVQRRIDSAAGQLAAIADERGAAGQLCERDYDALKVPGDAP